MPSLTNFFVIFHYPLTQALTALLSDDSKFGFIVIDGSGALFGTLQGNTREVLHKFTVDLPKKHGTDLQYQKKTISVLFYFSLIETYLKFEAYGFAAIYNICLISVSSLLGRGGQSALRFARLRMEKRHNYVRKVAETAVQLFVSNDKVNVAGMVLAGSADFKTELSQSDMFDPVSLRFLLCYSPPLKDLLQFY